MAIKYTSAEIAKNSVKVKPRTSPPTFKTPAAKPTMRSNAKDVVNKASAKANAKGLKAANKPTTSKSADAARAAAAKRALLVPPNKRTAAQKMALSRVGRGGGLGGLNINNLKK